MQTIDNDLLVTATGGLRIPGGSTGPTFPRPPFPPDFPGPDFPSPRPRPLPFPNPLPDPLGPIAAK